MPCLVAGSHGRDRIDQPAGGAHDRHGAVAQAVHLVQAARLEARRHQEHVGAAFDEVREAFVEADDARRSDRGAAPPGCATCARSARSPVPSTTKAAPRSASGVGHLRRSGRSPSDRPAATRCRPAAAPARLVGRQPERLEQRAFAAALPARDVGRERLRQMRVARPDSTSSASMPFRMPVSASRRARITPSKPTPYSGRWISSA